MVSFLLCAHERSHVGFVFCFVLGDSSWKYQQWKNLKIISISMNTQMW